MTMTNCCDDYGNCRQGRDCPVRKERIERVREAKAALDRAELRVGCQILGRLALGAAILLAILVGAMYHDALRAVA